MFFPDNPLHEPEHPTSTKDVRQTNHREYDHHRDGIKVRVDQRVPSVLISEDEGEGERDEKDQEQSSAADDEQEG